MKNYKFTINNKMHHQTFEEVFQTNFEIQYNVEKKITPCKGKTAGGKEANTLKRYRS